MRGKYAVAKKRITAFFVCVMLFLVAVPALSLQIMSAPLSVAAASQNGMVRVKLSSLGQPARLNVTIKGNYSVSGAQSFSVSQGALVSVAFSAANGQLSITVAGQTYPMGGGFRLRRHTAEGTNGVTIAEANVSSNTYPGDLSFSVSGLPGAYALNVIAYVFIEEYLYGVLPYEMGDGSPREALKAQAVAARTYTLRAMSSSAGRSYDVVDTTSDQVYNGTPSGFSNCKDAVNATRGIVMKNGAQFSATFYTASNGGQTESPLNAWGSSSYSYLTVRDDPYDFASTAASKKTCDVPSDAAKLPQALKTLLINKAKTLFPATAVVVLNRITSVVPHTPLHQLPSRLYTRMDFYVELTVNGAKNSSILSFSIFGELEDALEMSINKLDNELWSVSKTPTGFLMASRRYGHGIGMSQRGAMRMAQLGHTYDQIIAFYFPGCRRIQYILTKSVLSAYVFGSDSAVIVDQVDPAQMEGGGGVGIVSLRDTRGSLPVHKSADTGSDVVWALPHGATVTLLSVQEEWCSVGFGGISGYVQGAFLTKQGEPSGAVPVSGILGYGTVKGTDFLNLRAAASDTAQILAQIDAGEVVPIFESLGSWVRTQAGLQSGYVVASFLSVSEKYPMEVADPSLLQAVVDAPLGFAWLRESPGLTARALLSLQNGAFVTIVYGDSIWSRVGYGDEIGYVLTSEIKLTGSEGEEPIYTPEPTLPSAQVRTVSGSLNLRVSPWLGAQVLTTIPNHTTISVLVRGDEWTQTQYAGKVGYVMSSFLQFSSSASPAPSASPCVLPTAPPTPAPTSGTGEQDPNAMRDPTLTQLDEPIKLTLAAGYDSLNLRMGCSTKSTLLAEISRHNILMMTMYGKEWCAVIYEGQAGYCKTEYLDIDVYR